MRFEGEGVGAGAVGREARWVGGEDPLAGFGGEGHGGVGWGGVCALWFRAACVGMRWVTDWGWTVLYVV